jgi:UDP-N-acetylmuramyl pentapeptide phosphotransferase/UDP-N-acetylglucosamine-1-phosphate transferase
MLIGAIGIIVCSFLLCFYTIPILVKIANRFNIYDTPSHIKKHNRNITFLGGVALIVAFIIPISLFLPEEIQKPKYLTAYLILITIIFLHGIGDDFFNYSPKRKFVIQTALCSLLIYKTGFYLPVETMFAKLPLPQSVSLIITLISAIGIVNAYNLIDGSDGLAASISLIASLFYAACFYLDGNMFFCIIALSAASALTAFILYNKPPAYIFMGDSGSLFIGMLLATFTFVFIEEKSSSLDLNVSNRVILAFSFLSIPILDMVRLFSVRIYNKKSPFKGDNNHIHHLMANIGFTSKQTLLIIITFQILNIGIAFMALNKSWVGFVIVNVCTYTIVIQFLRQLKTYLSHRDIRSIGTITELDNQEKIEP